MNHPIKGVVLAGGRGTRLDPVSRAQSKQLLPVYDKPMIYYPLSVLMLAGIRDILLITAPEDRASFERLLGDGRRFGLRLAYAEQAQPEGLAQALIIAEDFIGADRICLILGDNIFYGQHFSAMLHEAANQNSGADIFACRVKNPERFGVLRFDEGGNIADIEEKPSSPPSDWAVTGLYFYDARAIDMAKSLRPSARGELEITDLNRMYLRAGKLRTRFLGRGFAWLDTGTPESLYDAASFVRSVQSVQNLRVACLEEIAWRRSWLSADDLCAFAGDNDYGRYLRRLAAAGEDFDLAGKVL